MGLRLFFPAKQMSLKIPSPVLSQIKAVVFDLDGVLFDSFDSNVAFYNHIMEHMGKPPVPEQLKDLVHRESIHGSLRALFGEGPEYKDALAYCSQLDFGPFIKKLKLFPDVHQTMETLARTVRLAVATNRISSTIPALENLDLIRFFEVVVTPADAGASKPQAEFMAYTLDKLSLTRRDVVYVGDSVIDQDLCLASDVPLVAFRDSRLKAWAHVQGMAQIPALLSGE